MCFWGLFENGAILYCEHLKMEVVAVACVAFMIQNITTSFSSFFVFISVLCRMIFLKESAIKYIEVR